MELLISEALTKIAQRENVLMGMMVPSLILPIPILFPFISITIVLFGFAGSHHVLAIFQT